MTTETLPGRPLARGTLHGRDCARITRTCAYDVSRTVLLTIGVAMVRARYEALRIERGQTL